MKKEEIQALFQSFEDAKCMVDQVECWSARELQGEASITQEHVENNAAVRKMLTERGIVPENLPPAEDVKKVERRLESEKKKLLKGKK